MTLYAPLSIDEIKFEVGGCGQSHKAKKGQRLSVTCEACEPLIAKHYAGWGKTAEQTALTDEEEAELAADEAASNAMFRAAGQTIGKLVQESLPEDTRRKASRRRSPVA